MVDLNLVERIQCTDAEKMECMGVIKTILNLAKKSRQNGLLSLESDMRNCPDFILKKGLQLIVNGFEPEYVKEILETYIVTDNLRGKKLLKEIITIEGLLCVQEGINPVLIIEKLASYFGESYSQKIEDYFEFDEVSKN